LKCSDLSFCPVGRIFTGPTPLTPKNAVSIGLRTWWLGLSHELRSFRSNAHILEGVWSYIIQDSSPVRRYWQFVRVCLWRAPSITWEQRVLSAFWASFRRWGTHHKW
jgi:hypothetical protein